MKKSQMKKSQMRTRKNLKTEAKKQFLARYWLCVAVGFASPLLSFALSQIGGAVLGSAPSLQGVLADFSGNIAGYMLSWVRSLSVSTVVGVVALEASYFFLRVFRDEKVRLGEFFTGLTADVGRKLGASFWQALFLLIWTRVGSDLPIVLLAVLPASGSNTALAVAFLVFACVMLVPLIVKSLSYSMMYYIVRECPKVSVRKALRLSITLMKGRKRKLLTLYLGFAGWFLAISAIAIGVVHIFFSGSDQPTARMLVMFCIMGIGLGLHASPFLSVLRAGFYNDLKRDGLRNRVITQAELDGAE